jgi:hypothetical protein
MAASTNFPSGARLLAQASHPSKSRIKNGCVPGR